MRRQDRPLPWAPLSAPVRATCQVAILSNISVIYLKTKAKTCLQ